MLEGRKEGRKGVKRPSITTAAVAVAALLVGRTRWVPWNAGKSGTLRLEARNPRSNATGAFKMDWILKIHVVQYAQTASLSHLRTLLPESSSWPLPAKRPSHATKSLFDSKSL